MFLELDLKKIKLLAEKNEEKNWRFRSFLKFRHDLRIDNIVHRLYREISEDIDCTLCGNCCRELRPLITKKEVKLIAAFLNVHEKKFLEHYTEFDHDEKKLRLRETPCSFLKKINVRYMQAGRLIAGPSRICTKKILLSGSLAFFKTMPSVRLYSMCMNN